MVPAALYTKLSTCCSNAIVTFQAISGEMELWAKPSAGLPASPKSVQRIEFSNLATYPVQATLMKQGVLLSLVLEGAAALHTSLTNLKAAF